jgi:hypothetical protein
MMIRASWWFFLVAGVVMTCLPKRYLLGEGDNGAAAKKNRWIRIYGMSLFVVGAGLLFFGHR